jgi:UDP-N-acetylglucosamine--N-acetylmuramyl-(pentapeptide) pyrophosphoryl-undecaprenol N-acetylglucosamine transferase
MKTVVLAAGGTGGHLFPAQALAEELVRRGYVVHLMTDERVKDYGKSFPAAEVHEIPSSTLSLKKLWLAPGRAMRLWQGYSRAKEILARLKPAAVAGFGGYPSLPSLAAAVALKVPTMVHEANAFMGRANRLLASRVTAVASSFPALVNLPPKAASKMTVTGNPVRSIALKQRAAPYRAPAADKPFRLLVFGGSQGAQFFARFMPEVIAALPQAVRRTLSIVQQCRPEDLDAVRAAYEGLDVRHELDSFFRDMPKRIASAHLVVCRAGASTLAELGVIGRPAVLVPLPHAIDNDQLRNAESFTNAGAGWLMPQSGLKADDFAAFLTRLRFRETELDAAARAALRWGRPDATERLADLVEKIAKQGTQNK